MLSPAAAWVAVGLGSACVIYAGVAALLAVSVALVLPFLFVGAGLVLMPIFGNKLVGEQNLGGRNGLKLNFGPGFLSLSDQQMRDPRTNVSKTQWPDTQAFIEATHHETDEQGGEDIPDDSLG
jgi:hypothetical protein